MQKIHPIHMGATGAAVANLHTGLLFIFFHESGVSPETRRALRDRLAPDVLNQRYGEATTELVAIWQGQLKNWPNYFQPIPKDLALKIKTTLPGGPGTGNGDVDEITAEALNWFIGKLGGH
jgi:hypothetical protein